MHIHTTVVSTVVSYLGPQTHLTAFWDSGPPQVYMLISLGNDLNLRAWLHPEIPSPGQPWPKIGRCKNASAFSLSFSSLFPISIWVNSEETHLLSHSCCALSYPLSSTLLLGSTKNSVATTLSVTFSLCPAWVSHSLISLRHITVFPKTLCLPSLYIPKVATQFLTDPLLLGRILLQCSREAYTFH